MATEVCVVLPFFNEQELMSGLPDVLERIRGALADYSVVFLCVDDGSTDATPAGLTKLASRADVEVLTHSENRGAGAAMGTGLAGVRVDIALVYDPDEAYAPDTLAPLIAAVERGADVATLSPYHPEGGVEGVGPFRLFLSRAASMLYRRRLRSSLHTFTCAVRAYRMSAIRGILPPPDDFTAAAWLMARALQQGLSVIEVPSVLKVRASGSSKMRILSTIRSHLRLLRDLSVTPAADDRPRS